MCCKAACGPQVCAWHRQTLMHALPGCDALCAQAALQLWRPSMTDVPESSAWPCCMACTRQVHVALTTLPVLQADSVFVDMLAVVRSGSCAAAGGSAVVKQLVSRCSRPLDTSDGILPTNVSPAGFVSHERHQASLPGLAAPHRPCSQAILHCLLLWHMTPVMTRCNPLRLGCAMLIPISMAIPRCKVQGSHNHSLRTG